MTTAATNGGALDLNRAPIEASSTRATAKADTAAATMDAASTAADAWASPNPAPIHTATEPSRNSLRKGDTACILQRETVFLANTLNGAHLRLFVIAEKTQKSFSLHRTKLGWSQ